MNKEELYNLALSDVHKYNLLNEIFAIRDTRREEVDYTISVTGFISLDVLNQYVNKINENTILKQALNEIKELLIEHEDLEKDILLDYAFIRGTILQIIDKVGGNE